MHVETTLDGEVISLGSLTSPTSVTYATEHGHFQQYTVASSSTQKLFDVSEDLSDFDVMFIVSSQDVEVEYVVANGGNEVVYTRKIRANLMEIIGSDDSRDSTHTEDWGADGTADTIDKVTVKNTGSSSANIKVLALT